MSVNAMAVYGGIETGGTKVVCIVGSGPDDIRAETRIPTTTPQATIAQCIEFFREQRARHGSLAGVGVACFGPVDLNPESPTYGFITSTPKPGWANTDIVGSFRQALNVPVGFDTDVNAAALAEWRWGAAQGLNTFIYLTVGTGIGGGGLMNGKPMHGLIHPEMGHIRVPHDRQIDPFAGVCPFHGDCLEGLASGPAITARWGQPADTLSDDHPAWKLEANYLALALMNFVCTLSPERIVFGGGVMKRQLLPLIRRDVKALLNNYVQAPQLLRDIDDYIVSPGLGERVGTLGALALAQRAGS
jgi:fructokinase